MDHSMENNLDNLAISIFSEILTIDQLLRNKLSKTLPKGMQLSHFVVLNHLSNIGAEKTPAQLAKSFHLTKGAMTNTLNKLENAGYIHIRPDWEDARRKLVAISPAGRNARDEAYAFVAPLISSVIGKSNFDELRTTLPVLRSLRQELSFHPKTIK